jgi:hypothetical protein
MLLDRRVSADKHVPMTLTIRSPTLAVPMPASTWLQATAAAHSAEAPNLSDYAAESGNRGKRITPQLGQLALMNLATVARRSRSSSSDQAA